MKRVLKCIAAIACVALALFTCAYVRLHWNLDNVNTYWPVVWLDVFGHTKMSVWLRNYVMHIWFW